MKMIHSLMKKYSLMKMQRYIRKICGVEKSPSSYSTSYCKYHYNRPVIAPCLSSIVACSPSLHGSKRWTLVAPIQTCSVVLPGIVIRRYCTSQDDDFPCLTRLKCRGYPSPLASFSNFFLTYLVIKPHLDASFSVNEFLFTSKQVSLLHLLSDLLYVHFVILDALNVISFQSLDKF